MFVTCKDTGTSCSGKKLGKSPVVVPTIINMGTMEMIACLWIILALSSVALSQTNFYTHGRYGKREESHAPDALPFFSGSRYGRSGRRDILSSANDESSDKNLKILPRVDRFFLGSRYGKRGGLVDHSTENEEQVRSTSNIKNLEAALSYIYRTRQANNQQRLMINDSKNYQQQINSNDGLYDSRKIKTGYLSHQAKFKSNSKWHWF